jgi:hypothetical protein
MFGGASVNQPTPAPACVPATRTRSVHHSVPDPFTKDGHACGRGRGLQSERSRAFC